MNRDACRVLYVDGYTVPDPKVGVPSSDAIGYGITASSAIRDGLAALGLDVVRPRLDPPPTGTGGGPEERLTWILANYRSVLRELVEDPPDVIFCFHIFSAFPVEIRRMLLDLGLSLPIVGYTHGSHWDPTDTFRFETYPGMEVLDLANLLAVDRIDACRTGRRFPRPTVVFNHAPVSSKNPELFARVMTRVLPHHDVAVLITRDFAPWQPGGEAIGALAARFPEQVVLGRDMPLDEYYEALWAADLQVSTATHESLGVSTLEAMYTGNCCVLPRVGSYPEICDGHPDVLYEPGEEPLEERLRWFLEHPEHRRAVASELQRMSARYHPRTVVQKIAAEVLGVARGNS
jgi:glycosyltransferase involved in cell wall biosynthesis